MEDDSRFLRQLSRFNAEVSRLSEQNTVRCTMREQIAACADAEYELRAALSERETLPGLTTILAERIARAEAETQVGVLIAFGNKQANFAKAWRDAEASVLSVPQPESQPSASSFGGRFFSIARVRDDSYRFFTISPAR